MREFRSSGSVRGALGNGRPYREHVRFDPEKRRGIERQVKLLVCPFVGVPLRVGR